MADIKDTNLDQFDEYINSTVAGKSDAEVDAELKRLELQQRAQEVEYKKYDIELKKEEFKKLQGKRQEVLETTKQKMASLRNFIANREATQARCNHRKGGTGQEAIIHGQGSSAMYCVIKHRLPNATYMVLCQRCNKEWHDAQGPWNGYPETKPATKGFKEALNFPTDNTSSVSSTFTFQKTSDIPVTIPESE